MHHTLLADIGIPMIFVEWPLMLCALLPVIFIETEVVRRRLSLPYRQAFGGTAKANVISTLAGVPLAWLFMFIVQIAVSLPLMAIARVWHSVIDSPLMYVAAIVAVAWTGPAMTSFWPVALAATLLLVPTFFVSVRIERRSCRKSWSTVDVARVDRTVWTANVYSYLLLFLTGCGWFGWLLNKGPTVAPAVARLPQESVDIVHLHQAIELAAADVRPKFAASVKEFDAALDDLRGFMREVAAGKIRVVHRIDTGRWQSYEETKDTQAYANYADRIGPVVTFERRDKRDMVWPLKYRFEFNRDGFMSRAKLGDTTFEFDERGRLKRWRGDKVEYRAEIQE